MAIGQFCDADCTAHYDKHRMWITDTHGTDIVNGSRDPATGLYMINLAQLMQPVPSPLLHSAATMTPLRSANIAQRVEYWAASMGAPVLSTLLQAMKRGYVTCPGLTTAQVEQHPPDFTATPKGHLRQRRQGLQSTKAVLLPPGLNIRDDTTDEFFPDAYPTAGPGQPAVTHTSSRVVTRCVPLTQEHFSDMAGNFHTNHLPVHSTC